ncbi:MAG TPA: hypothetical protein VH482_07515 [Thermomicrobiales bacterium]
MSVEVLQGIRSRVLPMFQFVAEEYRTRVPAGYPSIIDQPEHGVVGLQLDPSYSLSFVSDGSRAYADLAYRSPRNDARSSASREKFSGASSVDRRPLDPAISDQGLRNLISELISRWNFQPMIIYITDTD